MVDTVDIDFAAAASVHTVVDVDVAAVDGNDFVNNTHRVIQVRHPPASSHRACCTDIAGSDSGSDIAAVVDIVVVAAVAETFGTFQSLMRGVIYTPASDV